jgi:hypothetical protein
MHECTLLLCCSGRIPNCMHECALLPCCSGRIPNCMYVHAAVLHCTAVTVMQWQDTKLHVCACCCPALHCSHCNAVAGYQTACTNALFYPAAVAGYQTECMNAHGCPAAVAGYQTAWTNATALLQQLLWRATWLGVEMRLALGTERELERDQIWLRARVA